MIWSGARGNIARTALVVVVVLCSFLLLHNHWSSLQVWSTTRLGFISLGSLAVLGLLCVLDLFAYVSIVLYYNVQLCCVIATW